MKLLALARFFVVGLIFQAASLHLALAAEIEVSSGEHADFSRLVLRFEDRTTWEFGKVPGGFEFRSGDTETSYLLTQAFNLIPRDRIANLLDLGGGRLFLEVDCECHGDAFDLRDGEVVLDIKDGPSLSVSHVFNQALPSLPGATEAPSVTGASVLALGTADIPDISRALTGTEAITPGTLPTLTPKQARLGLPLFLPAGGQMSAERSSVAEGASSTGSDQHNPVSAGTRSTVENPDNGTAPTLTHPAVGEEDMSLRDLVAQTESALLEKIGRAAAQGLLQPNLSETESLIQQATDPLVQNAEEHQDRTDPTFFTPAAQTGIAAHTSIQTAIDRDASSGTSAMNFTSEGESCPDDVYFDVAAWGGNIEHGVGFGAYRTGLLGEFDIARPDAVLALAQHYIYLTFGAEATRLIQEFEELLERPHVLLLLAEIMDNRRSDRGRDVARYLACGGKVALWAALAQDEIRPGQEINGPAISATFSGLPIHLRRYLGPILINRLVEAGEEATAMTLRNAIDRVAGDPGAGMDFLDAKMAMQSGTSESVIKALDDVVTADTELAAGAILKLIEYKIGHNIEITEREISIAASHAFEQRGTETGRALVRAEIAALANGARFVDAFGRFSHYLSRGDIKPEVEAEIFGGIIEYLTKKGADAAFLRYMIGVSTEIYLSPHTRHAAASRLSDLGFHHEARELLGRSAQVPRHEDRRLFAQIALAENKYDVAIGYLAGMDDTLALSLRAEALAGKGDHIRAAQAFELTGDIPNQEKAAWRAGDWQQVARLNQGILGTASNLMLAETEPEEGPGAEAVSLQAGSALLSESQETRAIISDLFSEFSLP